MSGNGSAADAGDVSTQRQEDFRGSQDEGRIGKHPCDRTAGDRTLAPSGTLDEEGIRARPGGADGRGGRVGARHGRRPGGDPVNPAACRDVAFDTVIMVKQSVAGLSKTSWARAKGAGRDVTGYGPDVSARRLSW